MKNSTILLFFTVVFFLSTSCEGLLDNLKAETDDKPENIQGDWEAYAYFSNDFGLDENGEDFSRINQIKQIVRAKGELGACLSKNPIYEQEMYSYNIRITADKYIITRNERYLITEFDQQCKEKVRSGGGKSVDTLFYTLNTDQQPKLVLKDYFENSGSADVKITYHDKNRLELQMIQNDPYEYFFVQLNRKK